MLDQIRTKISAVLVNERASANISVEKMSAEKLKVKIQRVFEAQLFNIESK